MKYVKRFYIRIVVVVLGIGLAESVVEAQTLGSLHWSSYQENKLVIEKRTTLEQALKRLEQQFDVVFLYRTDAVKNKKIARTKSLPADIKSALQELLKGQRLSFKRMNTKTYGIYTKAKPRKPEQPIPVQQQVSGTVTDSSSGETLPGGEYFCKRNNDGHLHGSEWEL